VFQSAQRSPGAARTVLLLTTFLWLSSVTWMNTPHLPRENLGTPAASLLSARMPHSGPNTSSSPFGPSCQLQHGRSRTRKHFRNRLTTQKSFPLIHSNSITLLPHHIRDPHWLPSPSQSHCPWYRPFPLAPIPTLSSASSVHPEELEGIGTYLDTGNSTTPSHPRVNCPSPSQRTFRLCACFVFAWQHSDRTVTHPCSYSMRQVFFTSDFTSVGVFRPPTH
jgi:hypothetical protein